MKTMVGLLWLLAASCSLSSCFASFSANAASPTTATRSGGTRRRQQEQQQTILETIDNNFNYQTLSNVIATAGLREVLGDDAGSGSGSSTLTSDGTIGPGSGTRSSEYTLFAASNGAMAVVPNIVDLLAEPGFILHLRDLALFQMTNQGALTSNQLSDGLTLRMMNGESVEVERNQQGQEPITLISKNGQQSESSITDSDTLATNGVVHGISKVLLPSFIFTDMQDAIDSMFFKQLIVSAGMEETFRTRPLTVLAPTSEAFINVPSATFDDPTLLTNFINYHLIDGVYPSILLQDGPLPTLQGEPVYVSVNGDGSKVSFNGYPAIDINKLANNGIMYTVDNVLEPSVRGPTPAPTQRVITLADAVAADDQLNAVERAVTEVGYGEQLSQRPPKIVFAPMNKAFNQAVLGLTGSKQPGSEWLAHMQNLLQMHVSLDTTTGNELTDGRVMQMLNDENVQVSVASGGNVSLVGPDGAGGTVIGPRVTASNGVLYKIDGVLYPHWATTDIVQALSEDGRFSTLLDLLNSTGLENQLRSGEFTVIAPTDNAFSQIDGLSTSGISPGQLRKILEYHLIPKIIPSAIVQTGPIPTLGDERVNVLVSEGGGISFNNAPVIQADILAKNGLIYALGTVLDSDNIPTLPPGSYNETAAPAAPPVRDPPATTERNPQPDDDSGAGRVAASSGVITGFACLVASMMNVI